MFGFQNCGKGPWTLLLLFSHLVISDSFVTLWTVGHQAPLSMGFSRQEYWSGLLFPPPGDLSHPGIEPASLVSPALTGGFFLIHWAIREVLCPGYRERKWIFIILVETPVFFSHRIWDSNQGVICSKVCTIQHHLETWKTYRFHGPSSTYWIKSLRVGPQVICVLTRPPANSDAC